MKHWIVTVPGFPPVTIKVSTRPAAKYEAWKRYSEAGYRCSLIDFQARVTRLTNPV